MIQLAEHDACTGCGACAFKCPKHCISMRENTVGVILPHIDDSVCIECHTCEKVCPILNPVYTRKPTAAYAAWSENEAERLTSASGGIATEIYKFGFAENYYAVGAAQNKDFSVSHKLAVTLEEVFPFKNSKYVFSSAYDAFTRIESILNEDGKVIFIGLPCQVAAMRKLFHDDQRLLLVELVCHGTTPDLYLKQHVNMLEKQTGRIAKGMSFRTPPETFTFTLTLYDENDRPFYSKRTKDGDSYQFGYHLAVTYRENCYHCMFAKPQRVADITIADYHGLGCCAPCEFDARKVSLILTNSENGVFFINELIQSGQIHVAQRPLEEPFKGESRLRHPSDKNKYRLIFEKEIVKCKGDFECAIQKPLRNWQRQEFLKLVVRFPFVIARKIKKNVFNKR